jgi:hypothetical protein
MHKAKERLARMERRHLIAACIIVVLVATVIVATTIILVANTQKQPESQSGFSVSGEIVCLPHKNADGPQTLECSYGLRTDDNRYYALQYQPFPTDLQIGDRVSVNGTLTTGGHTVYNIVGTIKADVIAPR